MRSSESMYGCLPGLRERVSPPATASMTRPDPCARPRGSARPSRYVMPSLVPCRLLCRVSASSTIRRAVRHAPHSTSGWPRRWTMPRHGLGGPAKGTSGCVVPYPRYLPCVSSPPAAAAQLAEVGVPAGATILHKEEVGCCMSIMGFFAPPSCSARHEKGWANTPPERLLHPGRTGAPATLSAVGIDTDVPVVVEGHNRVRLRVGPFHAR